MRATCIFGFIFSFFLSTELLAQRRDTLQVYRYGLHIGADVSGYLYKNIYDKNFEGLGLYVSGRIYRDYFFDVLFGREQYRIDDARGYPFFSSITSGEYLKIGFFENILDYDLGIHGTMFYGVRYGYARYTQVLNSEGFYLSTYWDGSFGRFLPKEVSSDWTTHFIEGNFGTQIALMYGLNMSFQVRASLILSESDTFKILNVPGYGENRNFLS